MIDPHEKANRCALNRLGGLDEADFVRRLAAYIVHKEDGSYELANESLTQGDWDFITDMRDALSQDEAALEDEFRVSGGDHDQPHEHYAIAFQFHGGVSGFDVADTYMDAADKVLSALRSRDTRKASVYTDRNAFADDYSGEEWDDVMSPTAIPDVSGGDHDVLPDSFFRTLTSDEEAEFRQWARGNYTPGTPVNPTWHPIVREECERMNATYGEEERGDYVVVIWHIDDGNDSVAIAGGNASYMDADEALDARDHMRNEFIRAGVVSADGPFVDVLYMDMAFDLETVDDIESAKIDRRGWMVYAADGASLPDTTDGPYDTNEDAIKAAADLASTYYGDGTDVSRIDDDTWVSKRSADSRGGYTIWVEECVGDECPEDE